ncbi:MAG: superoxide dismutase [Patescibacteria group bacterium]|nr:MAG: superoxide dismutase [Patescibacteria group bacterium]
MTHELPKLPYSYDALEPHIDARTMEIHHTKHHQSYVDKLNAALKEYPDLQERPIEELLRDLNAIPEGIRTPVRRSGGGHYNHSLFWASMKNGGGGKPRGVVASAIVKEFGSFDVFKKEFTSLAVSLFGSGWAWLVVGSSGNLEIAATSNQDTPLAQDQKPILGLDVWEHAYYLKYQNRRADYVKAWWNVVNWEQAGSNFSGSADGDGNAG